MIDRRFIIAVFQKAWKPVLLFVFLRAVLEVSYDTLTTGVELRLQSVGKLPLWWGIVFLYFVVDLALASAFVWYFWAPRRSTLKTAYSLWDMVMDLAVLLVLMRLTSMLTDPLVFPFVVDLGLKPLHTFLRVAWLLWMVVFLSRLTKASRRIYADELVRESSREGGTATPPPALLERLGEGS